MKHTVIFIGLGNPNREDDAFGLFAIDLLQAVNFGTYFPKFKFEYYRENKFVLEEQIEDLNQRNDIALILFIDVAELGEQALSYRYIRDLSSVEHVISSHQALLALYYQMLIAHNHNVHLFAIQPKSIGFLDSLSKEMQVFLENNFISILRNEILKII